MNYDRKGMAIHVGALYFMAMCLRQINGHIHSQKILHIEQDRVTLTTWVSALTSALVVGACGVFPLVVNRWVKLGSGSGDSKWMKAILSFAVGGLLGDVFLHLLPEVWGKPQKIDSLWTGLWTLCGLVAFMLVEKVAKCTEQQRVKSSRVDQPLQNSDKHCRQWLGKDITGYLNLAANCTDNFTHGLAIAASYAANPVVGLLTTLAILCHEVPHEIGDFAILLSSGFDCHSAAKAQMFTSFGGVVGVVAGLTAEHVCSATHWLLPFTAGGFLYIALVTILPDLLESVCLSDCLTKGACLLLGTCVMAMVTIVEKKSCTHMPALL